MNAFNTIMEIVTGSRVRNGHALANLRNRESLAKANKEIEEMMKGVR